MIKKIGKWILILSGSLVAIALVMYAIVYVKTQSRINKAYAVNIKTLQIPDDSVSYARGMKIATNRGCMGCHGTDLGGGRAFLDEHNPVGVLYAANITSGNGGLQFKDADWIRVLRHGLGKDNKSVWLMPSQDIYEISNQDMGDLLHYVKSAPPVDRIVPQKSIKPLGRFLLFTNKFPLLPAEMINQNAVVPDSIAVTVSATYGRYLATTCQGCHSANLRGAASHEPGGISPPNITASGEVGKWKAEDFMAVFQKGITPQGRKLNEGMPWDKFTYSEKELKAIYLYLKSLK